MFKKIKKYFHMSKTIRNFAPTNLLRGGLLRLLIAGFFYACTLQTYGVTPVLSVNAPTASEALVNGSVTPFFLLPTNFIRND